MKGGVGAGGRASNPRPGLEDGELGLGLEDVHLGPGLGKRSSSLLDSISGACRSAGGKGGEKGDKGGDISCPSSLGIPSPSQSLTLLQDLWVHIVGGSRALVTGGAGAVAGAVFL